MFHAEESLFCEFCPFTCSRRFNLHLFNFRLDALSKMTDKACAGGSHYVFFERIALLGEAEGDGYRVVFNVYFLHHPKVHYVAVLLCGMMNFFQEFKYFFCTHFANSSSSMILVASPHFSTIQST